MDHNWVLAELQSFIDLTELVSRPQASGRTVVAGDNRRVKGQSDEIVKKAHVVEQILDRVIPTWRNDLEKLDNKRWQVHRQAALRAVSEIDVVKRSLRKLVTKPLRLAQQRCTHGYGSLHDHCGNLDITEQLYKQQ